MNPSAGLRTALNKMREMSVSEGSIYHQYVPVVTEDTSIAEFGQPILDENLTIVRNEFIGLVKRIAFTAINTKRFANPLAQLEGDRIPLGYAGQDVYVNRAKGRQFNVNDFAGLLQKYEAQVATQYLSVNMDLQYPVTITREKLRNAFISWNALEDFVSGIINSLYNGAQIDAYAFTKDLVASALKNNSVQYKVVTLPTGEATAKAFIKTVRELNTRFQLPSTKYNAWNKLHSHKEAITTWSDASDIVVLIRADVEATIDTDVLASAFNMSKADFIGRRIIVDDFDLYSDEGELVYDGSSILGMIADKSWFKIKEQDFSMDEFYNANNRCWNYYLNVVKMYNYSLFANAVVLTTAAPEIEATAVEFGATTATIEAGDHEGFDVTLTPRNASPVVEYAVTSGTASDLVLTASADGKHLDVRATSGASGNYVVTATAGEGVTDTITIVVE